MKTVFRLFGILLLLLAAVIPITMQYVVCHGPAWTTEGGTGRLTITAVALFVVLVGVAVSCFAAADTVR